jgi:hypothetical protein
MGDLLHGFDQFEQPGIGDAVTDKTAVALGQYETLKAHARKVLGNHRLGDGALFLQTTDRLFMIAQAAKKLKALRMGKGFEYGRRAGAALFVIRKFFRGCHVRVSGCLPLF